MLKKKDGGNSASNFIIDSVLNENILQSCWHSVFFLKIKGELLTKEGKHDELLRLLNNIENQNIDLPDNYIRSKFANTYYNLKQYKLALDHYLFLIEFGQLSDMRYASMHNNIGLCYYHSGDRENAERYYKTTLDLLSEVELKQSYTNLENFLYFKKIVQNNLYRLNFNNGDKVKLFENLNNEYQLGKNSDFDDWKRLLIELSTLAFELKNFKKADDYISILDKQIDDESISEESKLNYNKLKLIQAINFEQPSDSILIQLDQYLFKLNDFYSEKLNIYFENSYVDKTWSIKKLEEKETAIKTEQASNSKLVYSLMILFTIIVVVGYAFFYQRKVKRKIKGQNIIIEGALENSEMLIKEIHHRVKNNLEIVSSIAFLEYQKNENNFDFESFENKIISLSLIHQLLYSSENISKVRIDEYFQELMENLEKTCLVDSTFELKIIPINLPLEFAISFGFLLNELVTNTSKHCVPKKGEQININIALIEKDNSFEFIYQDNGYSENKNIEPITPNMGSGLMYHSGGKSLAFRRRL
ncbi:MAG: histidine kinase dimerization/phosphoacceptor domain -containing protein [Flavobacteriales bacterium]